MDDQSQEPEPLFSGGEEESTWVRWVVELFGSGIGLVLGVLAGWLGGAALDEAAGNPLGSSSGFLRVGHLTHMCALVGFLLGVALGAFAGHRSTGGKGRFWGALLGALVGVGLVVGVSLPGGGLVFPALLLLPIATVVGLELSAPSE